MSAKICRARNYLLTNPCIKEVAKLSDWTMVCLLVIIYVVLWGASFLCTRSLRPWLLMPMVMFCFVFFCSYLSDLNCICVDFLFFWITWYLWIYCLMYFYELSSRKKTTSKLLQFISQELLGGLCSFALSLGCWNNKKLGTVFQKLTWRLLSACLVMVQLQNLQTIQLFAHLHAINHTVLCMSPFGIWVTL